VINNTTKTMALDIPGNRGVAQASASGEDGKNVTSCRKTSKNRQLEPVNRKVYWNPWKNNLQT